MNYSYVFGRYLSKESIQRSIENQMTHPIEQPPEVEKDKWDDKTHFDHIFFLMTRFKNKVIKPEWFNPENRWARERISELKEWEQIETFEKYCSSKLQQAAYLRMKEAA